MMMLSYPEDEDIKVLWRVSIYVLPTRRHIPEDFKIHQNDYVCFVTSTYIWPGHLMNEVLLPYRDKKYMASQKPSNQPQDLLFPWSLRY